MESTADGAARYRILETIGRGGMGQVCLADDQLLHRHVAVKFLTSQAHDDALEQLLSEARAAAALDHPFICSIYEVTTLDDRPCIVMEYVRGETCERRLRRGPLPPADGLRYADEIAEALESAHKRRIIHGDLKPANILLTDDEHVKVMDFGLATRLSEAGAGRRDREERTDTGGAIVRGTPAYMAPEQIRGDPADRRSDIFAFGVLLFELLAGANPFVRSGVHATLTAILNDPVPDFPRHLSELPPTARVTIERMLAKDPDVRYQSFAEVRRDLRRLAGELSAPIARPFVVADSSRDSPVGLVGRNAERARVIDSVNQAAAGRGTVSVLTGDAGVGKTRLADEALAAARGLGCLTLVGRCYEDEGAPPLIPFIEALERASSLMPASMFRQAIGPGAPELAKLLPQLHDLFPDAPPPPVLPPQLRQRYMFASVREFLARSSRFAPVVVLLDDLHWADESTLQLLQHLARHVADLPVAIIAAHRDVEDTTADNLAKPSLFDRVRGQKRPDTRPRTARAALDELVRHRLAHEIAVRPLTSTGVRELLTALGHDDPPAVLVVMFLDQTGGNPFFATELFRHLNEEGRLFDGRGNWRRDFEVEEVDVPQSVRSVLERRLQRVSAATNTILKAAAVLGPDFETDLLQDVADVDEDTLISALDEAERARILKGPSGRQEMTWRFAHNLVCQTLSSAVPQLRRQRLHLRTADALVRAGMSFRTSPAAIAHHLYNAGRLADPSRTVQALIAAADDANKVYATPEAIRHYRRALTVLGPVSESPDEVAEVAARRLDIEERLADLLALQGNRPAAMTHYERVQALFEARSSTVDQARITRKIGALHWQGGDRAQAMALYEQALTALAGSAAHLEAAHLFQELGQAAFRRGDNYQAILWAERALQSAEEPLAAPDATSDERKAATAAIAHATNTIGVACARSGQLDDARAHLERSLSAAQGLGLHDVACRAYANLGVLYSTIEPKRAIDVSLAGLDLASKIGAASLQSYIYANLAAAYCALTDRCETDGFQAAQAAVRLDRELGQLDHLAVPLIVIGQIHQCRGELDKAQDTYREALALAEKIDDPQLIVPCYDGLATIYLDRGERVEAERLMEKSRQLCERTGLDPDSLLLLPFLC